MNLWKPIKARNIPETEPPLKNCSVLVPIQAQNGCGMHTSSAEIARYFRCSIYLQLWHTQQIRAGQKLELSMLSWQPNVQTDSTAAVACSSVTGSVMLTRPTVLSIPRKTKWFPPSSTVRPKISSSFSWDSNPWNSLTKSARNMTSGYVFSPEGLNPNSMGYNSPLKNAQHRGTALPPNISFVSGSCHGVVTVPYSTSFSSAVISKCRCRIMTPKVLWTLWRWNRDLKIICQKFVTQIDWMMVLTWSTKVCLGRLFYVQVPDMNPRGVSSGWTASDYKAMLCKGHRTCFRFEFSKLGCWKKSRRWWEFAEYETNATFICVGALVQREYSRCSGR